MNIYTKSNSENTVAYVVVIKLLHLAARNEEKLSATLTKEQKSLFEKYKDCTMDMCGIAEKDAFVEGVKLGVKIVVETYTDGSPEINEI